MSMPQLRRQNISLVAERSNDMGEEISRSTFGDEEFEKFHDNLTTETRLFAQSMNKGVFADEDYVIGFEIEAWLLDHNFFPNPINQELISKLGDPLLVAELSRFNVEMNCQPLALTNDAFSRANANLFGLWSSFNRVAHTLDCNMVMIGTLPVIRDEDLSLKNITPLKRYEALNNAVMQRRHGEPLVIEIDGADHLRSEHQDLMLEAATTSFQIHLKTPVHLAHRYYNASLMASAPLLAACTNAPFVFEKSLWSETRIPLFEQSVPLTNSAGTHGRVTFGSGYLDGMVCDVFTENLEDYPVILPLNFDQEPEAFHHLRLHNGTIWRWNRPLVGVERNGTAHVRLEHRTMPAGPTIIDMIANAACYIGLVRHMVDSGFDETSGLSFADATENYYKAAKYGLVAELAWSGQAKVAATELLLEELIPGARAGLAAFGVSEDDISLYLDIFAARVRSGQTGTHWQLAMHDALSGDFRKMMSAYCEQQRSALPVHQWSLS